jgi:phosphoglycolate phosphatase
MTNGRRHGHKSRIMRPSPSATAERFPALLFDLDGTLIDSAPDLAAALNRVLASAGREMLPFIQVRGMIGNGARKLVERGYRASGGPPEDLDAETERFLSIYGRALACHTRVYDGVAETLAMLAARGHRLGIVTNKPFAPTLGVLQALDLSRHFAPEHVVGGDSVATRKPDPEPLMALLDRMGHEAEAAIMIGDSANDIEAARAAGVRSIAVSYGYCRGAPADLGADRLVDRFGEVPAALADLLAR